MIKTNLIQGAIQDAMDTGQERGAIKMCNLLI